MESRYLIAITDMGDSALMLPLAVMLAVVLWTQQSTKAALVWLGTLIPGLAAMTVLKLVGHACSDAIAIPSLVSPSGHAAFAAMVYGSAAVVLARHTSGPMRWVPVLAAVGVVAAVAASRLLLEWHTPLEVVIGLVIGAITVALFAQYYRRLPPAEIRSRRMVALAGVAALLIVTLYGERLQAEEVIRTVAGGLRTQISACR